MKKTKFLFLLSICLSLALTNCTSDNPIYVAGEDGKDGVDGVDGVDGSAASCIACHASTHTGPITDAWMVSGHGSGGSWARGTSTSCAQCHNNEGYLDYLSGNFFKTDEDGDLIEDVNGDPIPSVNPDGYLVSNPVSCTGCHSSHRSFDFETDGNDYAVRNIDPVKLDLDPTIVIDFSNDADALGLSNACITCHQPRTSYPIPSGTADVTITSQRYGPHHSPQATVLQGVLGANIAGSTGYPGVGTAAHRTGASCTSCHMAPSDEASEGGHTWIPTLNSCTTCHSSMTEIPAAIANFEADFQTLHNLLLAAGYINEDGYVQGANGGNASGSNPLVVPVAHAQAIWNYKTLYEDQSHGIHNPGYSRALLANSIEALQ